LYQITRESARQRIARSLTEALDNWHRRLYPVEMAQLTPQRLEAIPESDLIFMIIRTLSGAAVGCGAVVLRLAGEGEVKHLWIDPEHRGHGLGERLLSQLERQARQEGCRRLILTTVSRQHGAVTLYLRNGYRFIDDGPKAVMEKTLMTEETVPAAFCPPS
jgi:putative acetyltransferase